MGKIFIYCWIIMGKKNYFFTSECVTQGHPDKVCDQISDAILDECFRQDPYSRVAVECLITDKKLIIAWEVTTKAQFSYEEVARKVLTDIGYSTQESWFDVKNSEIEVLVHTQSPDISQWVEVWGAGDQWIMFWYASNETEDYLPLTLDLSRKLALKLTEVRKNGTLPYLFPDWKTQVTAEMNENWGLERIDTIIISAHHREDVSLERITQDLKADVITPVLWWKIDDSVKIFINPTWKFVIWWPAGDTWLTWRKIIVDTYWGAGRHWWGAFSWKDPTKVDRSAAYIARFLAKNIVANWYCDKCEIQLSYAIWVAQPISIFLEDFWTAKVEKGEIIDYINEHYDLSPNWIIKFLDLRRPIYRKTAEVWHFWFDDYPWEKVEEWKL